MMQLSAPIYTLKRQAKRLARETGLPLHSALDQIAASEGFQSWSHLSAAHTPSPAHVVLSHLRPGEVALLGARPGQGKTLLGLEVAAKSGSLGRQARVFTLDYHGEDIAARFRDMGHDPEATLAEMMIDISDDICASHIIARLRSDDRPALALIDYLQLLDQKRSQPGLQDQVANLKAYARATGTIFLVISQIDRTFELGGEAMPDRADIRLPNPLDLTLFDRFFFLHQGQLRHEPGERPQTEQPASDRE